MVIRKVLTVLGLSYIASVALHFWNLKYSQPTDFEAMVKKGGEISDHRKLSRQPLIDAVLAIYSFEYSDDKMKFYSPHVVYDDPTIVVEGRTKLATMFRASDTFLRDPNVNLQKVVHGSDFVVVDIIEEFTFKGIGVRVKLQTSLLLYLEGEEGSETIVRHFDKFYGKPLLGTEDPSILGLGHVAKQFRRLHGHAVCFLFPIIERFTA